MKKEIKGFAAGVIATILLFGAIFTASAEPIQKNITAVYNNVKIYVDGNLLQTKDAKGKSIEPFSYNGVTYVPVKAISDSLGKTIAWDAANNSIYIGKQPAPVKPAPSGTQVITVGTAEEFVKALGSNRKIVLKAGVYDLSRVKQVNSQDSSIQWKQVYDGKELNLQNISNLTIEGAGRDKTELRVAPRYANIMSFKSSKNITIKNIKAGHTPAEYECDEGVLYFNACEDITISGAELYGCGSTGLTLYSTSRLSCDNTLINHCSLRALSINDSNTVKFTKTIIANHEAYNDIISASGSKNVIFEECQISDNHNFGWAFIVASGNSDILLNKCKIFNNTKSKDEEMKDYDTYFFTVLDYFGNIDGKITVKNSEISNNTCDNLTDCEDAVIFENCKLNNNIWKK